MFSCVVHNWNSFSEPCPMCFPDTLTSASGAGDDIVIINRAVYPCPSCAALQSSLKEKDQEIEWRVKNQFELEKKYASKIAELEELKAENEKLNRLVPDHPKAIPKKAKFKTMSKTAMQELIDELKSIGVKVIGAEGYLAKEKEQMERAFKNPYRLAKVHPGNNMNKDWEFYFNDTYKNKQ